MLSSNSDSDLNDFDSIELLQDFSKEAWGNPRAFQKHTQGIEYIELGRYLPAIKDLFSGIVHSSKILIRDEYDTAVQILQTEKYARGACVTGQPGIGKTHFLLYALVQLLGNKKPIVMQPLDGEKIYLLFIDGTVSVHSFTDKAPFLQGNQLLWALCDSNDNIQIPAYVFQRSPERVRIIQATSPQPERWKSWSKHVGASCYIMDLWSLEEIKGLAILSGLQVDCMVTLARKWGAVPELVISLSKMDLSIEANYRSHASQAIQQCQQVISGIAWLDLPPKLKSPFYFVRPSKSATGVILRDDASPSVPTETLRIILAKALVAEDDFTRLQFFAALSRDILVEACQTARFIFESWFHCFVLAGKSLECHWLQQPYLDAITTPELPITLTGTTALVSGTKDALRFVQLPFYWVAPSPNFPGIDSALVFNNVMFVFQVAIGERDTLATDGLKELRNILPAHLKELPCGIILVGASKEAVKAAATDCSAHSESTDPVAWSTVDPVRKDIAYTVIRRGESDWVPKDVQEMDIE